MDKMEGNDEENSEQFKSSPEEVELVLRLSAIEAEVILDAKISFSLGKFRAYGIDFHGNNLNIGSGNGRKRFERRLGDWNNVGRERGSRRGGLEGRFGRIFTKLFLFFNVTLMNIGVDLDN